MLVNATMANISFASYLRDRLNNQPYQPCQQFRTRLPQPPPLQTNNNAQSIWGAYSGPPFKPPLGLNTPFGRSQQLVPPHNMSSEGQVYFKDYVRHPDDLYLSSNLAALPTHYRQDAPAIPLSWWGDTNQYTFADTTPQLPCKVESSPALPTPSVLPRTVDASEYESLSYDDWYSAPTLYQSSSPDSIEDQTDSPITPYEMFPDHPFSFQSLPTTQSYDSYGTRLPSVSKTNTAMVYQMTQPSLSTTYHTTHEGTTALPSFDGILMPSAYQQPLHPQFHHHYMVEPSLSPEDFDVQTPYESEDDLRDEMSSASASPQCEILTNDDGEAREQRNELLLRMRDEGHSYRDIKRLGRFKEAESTLRGRYRALTKDKEERVRKPQWEPNDEMLLRRAVRYYSNGVNQKARMRYGRRKLPWKKISQRMKDHGSSYLFAPATCAKKWEVLAK